MYLPKYTVTELTFFDHIHQNATKDIIKPSGKHRLLSVDELPLTYQSNN